MLDYNMQAKVRAGAARVRLGRHGVVPLALSGERCAGGRRGTGAVLLATAIPRPPCGM